MKLLLMKIGGMILSSIWRIHHNKYPGNWGTKLLNLLFWMISYIIEQLMVCSLSVSTKKKIRFWWERFMKEYVVFINLLIWWSGWLDERVIFGRPCWRIVWNIIKGVKSVKGLVIFKNLQHRLLNPIVKPWPFRGWGIDLIVQIFPSSSKGHKFVLVATDYFTKWVELFL